MATPKQPKRVSWPSDTNLCKVRLFLSEDAPSQSGIGGQDQLQAKAAWLVHAAAMGSDDSLPPGFEAPHSYQHKVEISRIPLIKWQCPSRLALNLEWQVVAGEESEEVFVQNQRQLGVIEAIYPRMFSIPPNPAVSPEVQDICTSDDSHTPLIPITAIEDDDSSDQADIVAPSDTPIQLQCLDILTKSLPDVGTAQHILPDIRVAEAHSQHHAAPTIPNLSRAEQPLGASPNAEPDVVAAASAAFTAIMRSCEEGSLIDRDLLIKFLSNPSLLEKLVSQYGGTPKQNPLPPPVAPSTSTQPPPPPHMQMGIRVPLVAPPNSHNYPLSSAVAAPSYNPQPPLPVVQIASHPLSQVPTPPVRDLSYYKTLVQQHGGEQQVVYKTLVQQHGGEQQVVDSNPVRTSLIGSNGGESILHGSKLRDSTKPKIQKPCVYYNTPRGCRNGASCSYQHDASVPQRIEQPQGTKRIKLDRDSGIA